MLTVLSCCHGNCQLQSVYALNFCLEVLFNVLKFHEIPADELLPGSMQ